MKAIAKAAVVFALVMVVLSIALNAWSLLRLRVWNPSGEPVMQRERPEDAAVWKFCVRKTPALDWRLHQ